MRKLFRGLATYLVSVVLIGTVAGLLFQLLRLLGLVKIHGYWRIIGAARSGQTIFVANHPTLVEVVLLPLVFWPWALFWPQRLFPWSVPDKALFPRWLTWLYPLGHCVKIDRSSDTNRAANREIINLLNQRANIIVHPEGGRTASPFRGRFAPKKRYGRHQNRQIRRLVTQVPTLAHSTGASIFPIWIEIPFRDRTNDFRGTLWHWLASRQTITIYAGEPYQVTSPKLASVSRKFWLHLANKELGKQILRAGHEDP